MKKIIVNFHDSGKARDFAQRARKLPGVTYATDYCKTTGCFHEMVCGEWDEEQEKRFLKKRI